MKSIWKQNKQDFILFGFACLAILVKFAPFLVGKTLFFGDNYSLMVPGKLFSSQWILNGILPLWNPYIFAGINWIGDINQSLLYPTTVLFILFSPAVALNISIVTHLAIAYVSMYLLSRSFSIKPLHAFVVGCLWMFSTQILGSIHNLSTLQALVWLPLVMWAGIMLTKYRWGWILMGIVTTIQFAGGYPQHSLYSVFAAVIFSAIAEFYFGLHDRYTLKQFALWCGRWLLAGILTLALSAVFWMPFVEAFFQSTRMQQTLDQAQLGSLNPIMLAKMIAPAVFDNPIMGMKWGPAWSGQPNVAFYVGWFSLFILLLNLVRWRSWSAIERIFAVLITLTSVFSLGSFLPGYKYVQMLMPLLKWGRYPSMMMIITTVVMNLWIGILLEKVKLTKKWIKRLLILAAVLSVAAGMTLILATYSPDVMWKMLNAITADRLLQSKFHTLAKDMIILQSIMVSFMLSALFFCCAVLTVAYKKPRLLVFVIVVDVLISTQWMFIFADNSIYGTRSQLVDVISPFWQSLDTKQYRTLTRNNNAPFANFGGYWEALIVRAPFSDSFVNAQELESFDKLVALRNGLTPNWNMVASQPMIHGYTTLLPMDFDSIWQRSTEPRINFIDPIRISDSNLRLWSTKYYVVDEWYPDYGEQFPDVVLAADDRWKVYELSGAQPRIRFENSEAPSLTSFEENPNKIEFVTSNEHGQRELIIADRYDRNWHVSVNGNEVPLENWQGMRRFAIQEGPIAVKMWYHPVWFYRGLLVSGITLLGMLLAGGLTLWRRRKTGS